jgi:VWFA-related protein
MHQLNKTWGPALAAFLCGGALIAQDAVFRSDTRRVNLQATVVDNRGRLVTDLKQDAFTVFENNKRQAITQFIREDTPVSIGLIIDNSGSIREKRRAVESAALAMVKASNPEDEVFIVNFNDEAFLDVPFTHDMKKLEEGLTKFDARGGTAMRDAIIMSMDYMKEKSKLDKKILVVVTDGEDNYSSESNTLEKLIARAQQSGILIYTFGILTDEERSKAKAAQRALRAIADATGALSYFPQKVEEVGPLALEVAHEIRNQYVLVYPPAEQSLDGTFRQIRVEAKGPNSPKVRTRSGYWATKDEKPKAQ